jgi:multiple sugar transport system substrate-binding protein
MVVLFMLLGCWSALAGGGREAQMEKGVEVEGPVDYSGVTITIATLAGGTDGAVSGGLYYFRDDWERETGGKVNIAEIPFAQMPSKIKTDLITGAGKYDAFVCCGTLYGDFIAGNFIIPIDEYYNDTSGRFPEWSIDDMAPAQGALYKWGGKLYGVMYDADGWIIYGNEDAFTNPEAKKKFAQKYGYELRMPRTTDEYIDMCEFFDGWDWDNDGEVERGNAMPLRVGGQAPFWFAPWLANYVTIPGPKVDAFHNTTFFNPETMDPIINTPGAVKALEDYVRLFKASPPASIGWDLTEAWDYFVKGNAALSINPGDIGSIAQGPSSRIQGKLLSAPMPGRRELWDRQTNSWKKYDKMVRVGNTFGCSWHGVISRLSNNPEATYHFLSYLAVKERSQFLTYYGWTGVDFGKIYDFPPEVSDGKGTGSLEGYLEAGFDKGDVVMFLEAVWQSYYESDAMAEFLRIPGTSQLYDALDVQINEALLGKKSAKEALDSTAKSWNEIVDTLGRDTLKLYYQQSVRFGQEPPIRFE